MIHFAKRAAPVAVASLLVCAAGRASAQTTTDLDPVATASIEATTPGAGPARCRPRSLKGRYRLYLEGGASFCTIELKRGGGVRPQDEPETVCRGLDIDSPVLGGRLVRRAPLPSRRGGKGQCWLEGAIEVDQGKIDIVEAFVMTRGGGFAGVFVGLDGRTGTFVAVRY